MRFVGPVRGALGLRTIFNVLGPLTNPAGASMDIIGVYEEELVEPVAQVLMNLGVKKGMVVFGQDTMDEITPSTKTTVCEIRNGETKSYEINPEDYGISICKKSDLEGGDGTENAQITKDILSGKLQGPKRDAVLLNAAACIYVQNDHLTYEEAINIARETIDSGKAYEKLQAYIEESNK